MAENEIGHALPNTSRVSRRVERTPELRWPHNQYVYEAMMRTNSKVSQVVTAITQPIERAQWSVAANGAPDEIVEHVAGDLRLPVHGKEDDPDRRYNGRVSWDEHLQKAIQSIFFGVQFFEQVYEVGDDGKEHLVKLAHRHNTTIKEIRVSRDGGLEGIVQKGDGTHDEVFIPVNRLVAYVFRPRDTSWTGESVLRPAYPHWQEVIKLESLNSEVLQRNGMGVPMHKQSLHTADDEREEAADQGLDMATSFAAGEAAGGTLKPGEDLELKGVSGSLVEILPSIDYHNQQIAVAVNATHLNLEGQGGSYALAETKTSEFFQQIQSIAEWIASTATQHVVEDLVRIAFPEYTGPVPQITMTSMTAKKELAPGDLAQLINAKLFTLEPNIEAWARQTYDIPAPRPLHEALEAKKSLQEAEQEIGVTLREEPVEEPARSEDEEEGERILARYIRSVTSTPDPEEGSQ